MVKSRRPELPISGFSFFFRQVTLCLLLVSELANLSFSCLEVYTNNCTFFQQKHILYTKVVNNTFSCYPVLIHLFLFNSSTSSHQNIVAKQQAKLLVTMATTFDNWLCKVDSKFISVLWSSANVTLRSSCILNVLHWKCLQDVYSTQKHTEEKLPQNWGLKHTIKAVAIQFLLQKFVHINVCWDTMHNITIYRSFKKATLHKMWTFNSLCKQLEKVTIPATFKYRAKI